MRFDLTEREQEIYKLMATTDLTLAEIGEKLFASRTTIETHRNAIHQKLGVNKRSAVIRHYYEDIIKNGTINR